MRPDGILILGGTGFIGRALSLKLAGEGRAVHVLARHAEQAPAPNITMHRGSLEDAALLRRILPQCGTVVHAASTTTPGVSAQQPSLDAMQNLLPTLKLLEVLREFERRDILFFSSGGTFYGSPAQVPVPETQPFAPQSNYGAGKVAIEAFLHAYHAQGGGNVTILRPSNVYGAGQPFRPGFGVIRTMLEHALRGTTQEIWGDGEVVRDFLYIDDLVDACAMLLRGDLPHVSFNIGYGEGHTINRVLQAIATACGIELAVKYTPSRQVDVKAIVLDTEKIQQAYQWKAAVSLEQGIARTWSWLQKAAQT
jgi:UDP-glucose 4-epimerase